MVFGAKHGCLLILAGVAAAYREFLDMLVVDVRDQRAADILQKEMGIRVQCAKTVMRTAEDKADLAANVLSAVRGQASKKRAAAEQS